MRPGAKEQSSVHPASDQALFSLLPNPALGQSHTPEGQAGTGRERGFRPARAQHRRHPEGGHEGDWAKVVSSQTLTFTE